jgi:hypothetical protein
MKSEGSHVEMRMIPRMTQMWFTAAGFGRGNFIVAILAPRLCRFMAPICVATRVPKHATSYYDDSMMTRKRTNRNERKAARNYWRKREEKCLSFLQDQQFQIINREWGDFEDLAEAKNLYLKGWNLWLLRKLSMQKIIESITEEKEN